MTTEAIVDLLTHEDWVIRNTALQVLEKRHLLNSAATSRIIQTIQKHGLDEAFTYPHMFRNSPLNETSARCLLDEMKKGSTSALCEPKERHLANWLEQESPLSFLEENLNESAGAISKWRGDKHDSIKEGIRRRIGDSQLSTRDLLDKVKACFQELDEDSYFYDLNQNEIRRLVDLMPDDVSELEDEVLDVLKNIPDNAAPASHAFFNFACFLLAGKMRLEKAVPFLLKHMELDWECFSETIPTVLAEIGTDHTLDLTHEFYLKYASAESSSIPNYVSATFEETSNPKGGEIASKLLPIESDDWRISNLVGCLCFSMNGQYIEEAIEAWRESGGDPEIGFHFNFFYTHSKLSGKDFPEFSEWEESIKAAIKKKKDFDRGIYPKNSLMDRFQKLQRAKEETGIGSESEASYAPAIPYYREEKKVGRNELCPCDSGKKYKKCCGKLGG